MRQFIVACGVSEDLLGSKSSDEHGNERTRYTRVKTRDAAIEFASSVGDSESVDGVSAEAARAVVECGAEHAAQAAVHE